MADRYRDALLDWLACAARGAREPAAVAGRGAGDALDGALDDGRRPAASLLAAALPPME